MGRNPFRVPSSEFRVDNQEPGTRNQEPTKRLGFFIPALVATLAFVASCSSGPSLDCSSDSDCGDHHICLDGVCRDLHGPCTSDAQCMTGQVCAGGICESACAGDHDCPAQTFCDAGHCLPGCRSDTDCPIGTLCNPGTHGCEPGCRSDDHCPVDQRCRDGQCVAPECLIDADCLAGMRCVDGDCQPPETCEADADCPQGQRCVEGTCQDPECALNADCEAGQVCTDGWCVPDDSCDSDMDCPLGQICQAGRCVDAGCAGDADCPDGQACQAGQCVEAGCAGDADCPAGQHCLDGDCYAQECLTDGHCPAGQVCEQGACATPVACDFLAQDCPDGQKCTVDANGQPTCAPAGDGSQCAAGQADDCPAGQLCTGYDGFACHWICDSTSGQGCAAGMFCEALPDVPGLGTCQCDPLAQTCPPDQRCVLDDSMTPDCLPAGDGSQCFAGGLDDCPAGMACATADGQAYDCFQLCLLAGGAGCPPYHACVDAGMPQHGLCLWDCHPVRQDCAGADKCTIDEYAAPICYWNAGAGAACRAGTDDDCPTGQVCASEGAGFDCYPFCIVSNGIGCAAGEACAALEPSVQWGACVAAADCAGNADCAPWVCRDGQCVPCDAQGAPPCDAGETCGATGDCEPTRGVHPSPSPPAAGRPLPQGEGLDRNLPLDGGGRPAESGAGGGARARSLLQTNPRGR